MLPPRAFFAPFRDAANEHWVMRDEVWIKFFDEIGAMLTIQRAQLAMNDVAEYRDTLRAVPINALVDEAAWTLYPRWKEQKEEWDRTGSDHPYH